MEGRVGLTSEYDRKSVRADRYEKYPVRRTDGVYYCPVHELAPGDCRDTGASVYYVVSGSGLVRSGTACQRVCQGSVVICRGEGEEAQSLVNDSPDQVLCYIDWRPAGLPGGDFFQAAVLHDGDRNGAVPR